MLRRTRFTPVVSVALMAAPCFADATIYCDDEAPGSGDGLSWSTAHRYLQDALAHAAQLAPPVEIRLGKGVYRPDMSDTGIAVSGDRKAVFTMLSGVTIRGGYAGIGEGDANQWNPSAFESKLTGDIPGVNSYHIVFANGASSGCTLEGVVIANANASGGGGSAVYPYTDRGGGIYLHGTTINVSRCRIENCFASNCGAALWLDYSTAVFADCEMATNHVSSNSGCAIQDVFQSHLTLTRCTVRDHHLPLQSTGGGVAFVGGVLDIYPGVAGSVLIAESCKFINNSGSCGGAILNNGYVTLVNCLLEGNQATGLGFGVHTGNGGAVANFGEAHVHNCTFAMNGALLSGGGFFSATGGSSTTLQSKAWVYNSVLWGNTGAMGVEGNQIHCGNATLEAEHNCIEGSTGSLGGVGNFDANPLFVDPVGYNFALLSGSPCIDRGSNARVPTGIVTDLAGEPRRQDDRCTADCAGAGNPRDCGDLPVVDIGALEFRTTLLEDLDCDGCVSGADLGALLGAWGQPGLADFNADGTVDGCDLGILFDAWTACP